MEKSRSMRADNKPPPDQVEMLRLVEQIAQGSDLAFERFWRKVEPRVDAAVHNPRLMQKLAQRPAERADCKQTVALKLRRVLPTYIDYSREKQSRGLSPSLARWVAVIINNTTIDFRRKHPEYRRAPDTDESDRRWRTFVEVGQQEALTGLSHGDITDRNRFLATISEGRQARKMLSWARANLPAHQLEALLRWLQAEEGRQSKETRAALRKLRDQFREEPS